MAAYRPVQLNFPGGGAMVGGILVDWNIFEKAALGRANLVASSAKRPG